MNWETVFSGRDWRDFGFCGNCRRMIFSLESPPPNQKMASRWRFRFLPVSGCAIRGSGGFTRALSESSESSNQIIINRERPEQP